MERKERKRTLVLFRDGWTCLQIPQIRAKPKAFTSNDLQHPLTYVFNKICCTWWKGLRSCQNACNILACDQKSRENRRRWRGGEEQGRTNAAPRAEQNALGWSNERRKTVVTKLQEVFICPKRRKFTQSRTAPVDVVLLKKKEKGQSSVNVPDKKKKKKREAASRTLFSEETQFATCHPCNWCRETEWDLMYLVHIKYSWDAGLCRDRRSNH